MMMSGAAFLVLALAAACSTEEQLRFAENGCVVGGCQGMGGRSSSSAAGSCAPNPACAVSFKTDIFAGILDGAAGCTASGCPAAGTANGNLELNPGAAAAAYSEILNYVLSKSGSGPYIVPCSPQGSKMLCNLSVEGTNPYPLCGIAMPVGKTITLPQFNQISEWIACGAPDN